MVRGNLLEKLKKTKIESIPSLVIGVIATSGTVLLSILSYEAFSDSSIEYNNIVGVSSALASLYTTGVSVIHYIEAFGMKGPYFTEGEREEMSAQQKEEIANHLKKGIID